jgi:hypothetical protein
MARLKARGREEVLRLVKIFLTKSGGQIQKTHAVMSDGNILEKVDQSGWTVRSKVKPGLTPEQILAIYIDEKWQLLKASPEFFNFKNINQQLGYQKVSFGEISGSNNEPLRSEAKAAREKSAAEKRAQKPKKPGLIEQSRQQAYEEYKASEERKQIQIRKAKLEARKNEPGFFVTKKVTKYKGLSATDRDTVVYYEREVIDGPYESFQEAENLAIDAYRELKSNNFSLPVKVIESKSLALAGKDVGHVWWINEVYKGPPVNPRQIGFGF